MADNEDNIESIIEYQDDIADAKQPSPLPVGKYSASIVAATVATGKASGKRYCDVTFMIPAEQYPADYVDGMPEGTKLHFRKLSPEATAMARFGMKRFVSAIGAPMGRNLNMMDWIGREATLDVQHREWEGNKQADINSVEPA